MLYLIFVDGALWSVSTDSTNAANLAQEICRQEKPQCVRVLQVTGSVREEIYADDKAEE